MSLKKMVMGTALALGSCATVPKLVCSYQHNGGHCTREYENAVVSYSVLASDEGVNNQPLCIANVIYPADNMAFQVLDVGCDGTADLYIDYKLLEGIVGELDITRRDMSNKEHDKFFGELEKIFKDKAFQKLKKKVLGDKR